MQLIYLRIHIYVSVSVFLNTLPYIIMYVLFSIGKYNAVNFFPKIIFVYLMEVIAISDKTVHCTFVFKVLGKQNIYFYFI